MFYRGGNTPLYKPLNIILSETGNSEKQNGTACHLKQATV